MSRALATAPGPRQRSPPAIKRQISVVAAGGAGGEVRRRSVELRRSGGIERAAWRARGIVARPVDAAYHTRRAVSAASLQGLARRLERRALALR